MNSSTSSESHFILVVRVVAGITCLLSVFGACVIILTYVAFKDLRTLARQQLVNLCVADIIVAASHFVGLAALKVENYNHISYDNISNTSTAQEDLCRVQGGFTMFGTLASFLWTLALGFYLLMIIVARRPDFARYLIYAYYLFCWGVPFILVLWFALVKPTYLGFGEGADTVWCYIRVVPNAKGQIDQSTTILAEVLGYELWFYGTVFTLAAIYITMLFYLKFKVSWHTTQNRRSTDLKLIFVPLIFFVLRVWSATIDIIHYSTLKKDKVDSLDSTEGFRVLLLLAGIGDSAQGLANAILFCAFTKQVRQKLQRSLYGCLCCCCPYSYCFPKRTGAIQDHSTSLHDEATTQFDGESIKRFHTEDIPTTKQLEDKTALLNTLVGNYGTKNRSVSSF